MSRGGEDPAWELMMIREYDKQHGLEPDPFATVGVYPGTVCCYTDPDSSLLSPREARCLAASLLRAADEADKV